MRYLTSVPVVALLGLFCSCGGEVDVATDDGNLQLAQATAGHVSGAFSRDGLTIRFDAARAGTTATLSIATAEHPLVDITSDDTQASMSILGGPRIVGGGDGSAFQPLLAAPETALVPYLSRELGAAGLTGRNFPATFSIHGLGEALAASLHIQVPEVPLAESVVAQSGCQDLRSDPHHDQCFGMCGPGCTCWHWTCGDCCWHMGCAAHDTACRTCSLSNPGACAACYTFSAFFTGGGCG